MNKPVSDMGKTVPMRAETVSFTNGMIVTADDLSTAMAYPIALMQSVNRAVFGCGVVCGLEIGPDPDLCKRTERCDPCDENNKRKAYPSTVVEIGRGTALDCSGLPVELCKPVRFDLGTDRCGCDGLKGKVCIYIRRVSSAEAPRGDCCAPSTAGPVQCSRLQDHVEIRAFPEGSGPEHACRHPFEDQGGSDCGCDDSTSATLASPAKATENNKRHPGRNEICKCLSTCSDGGCCGEGWILLGCVELCKGGIVVDSLVNDAQYQYRKRIKTIDCICREVDDAPAEGEGAYYPERHLQERHIGDLQEILSREPDPDFKDLLSELVNNESHVATFLAVGVRNLEELQFVLENEQTSSQLQKAFNHNTMNRLQEYLAKVREELERRQKP